MWNGLSSKLKCIDFNTAELLKALYDELPVIREQTKLWTVKYFFAASTTLYIAIDIAIVRKIALFCLFAETIAFSAFLWEKMRYKRKILNWIVKIENSF